MGRGMGSMGKESKTLWWCQSWPSATRLFFQRPWKRDEIRASSSLLDLDAAHGQQFFDTCCRGLPSHPARQQATMHHGSLVWPFTGSSVRPSVPCCAIEPRVDPACPSHCPVTATNNAHHMVTRPWFARRTAAGFAPSLAVIGHVVENNLRQ
jgi:hypothetical protein